MHPGSLKLHMKHISPVLFAICLLGQMAASADGQTQDITCQSGHGEYSFQFSTGVSVVVGPVRKDGFAERVCAATLSWKGKELSVAADMDQVGIDVLGADLGFGEPVVALQLDEWGLVPDRFYLIYFL